MIRWTFFILLIISTVGYSQFKGDDKPISINDGISNSSPSNFLTDFIDFNKFNMSHTIGMSYSTFGGNGIAISTYTNSISYHFTSDLMIEADVSLVASPYSSFGTEHQKSINGIYLSRAQISYSPTKNSFLSIQFVQPPPGTYYYGGSMIGSSPFGNRIRRGF